MNEEQALPIPYGWYFVAYSDELAAGQIENIRYFDREMVLFRTDTEQVCLTGAYCPHLGANLGVGGRIVDNAIQCPFHGWRFDTRGHCVDVPYASNIPPRAQGKQCLQTYPVKELNGIIWAWYHPEQREPLFAVENMVEGDEREWTAYQKFTWTISTQVQETGENAVDTAHFLTVHKLEAVQGKPEITFAGHQRISDLKIGLNKISASGELVAGEFIDGRIYTACSGPGQTWTRQRGFAEVDIIGLPTPISQTQLELRFACSMPVDQHGNKKAIAQAIIDTIVDQVEQDIPIWENKIYLARPMLCDGDGPIAQYRNWFKQFYVNMT